MGEFREDPAWRTHLAEMKKTFLAERLGPPMLAEMRADTPVDTGALRESLSFEVIGEDLLRFAARQRYATPVHEGHVVGYRDALGQVVRTATWVDGQPFMTPTLYRRRGGGS
ncbi:hypothetical protein AB0425_17535 [Actinosynnema sp. NPDC051121]